MNSFIDGRHAQRLCKACVHWNGLLLRNESKRSKEVRQNGCILRPKYTLAPGSVAINMNHKDLHYIVGEKSRVRMDII
jgi:hypothetical protein